MLDAYSIRKAAPRLLIAVIGINLSIYLCVAAIDVTNIIGRGLIDLISEPFVSSDTFKPFNIDNTAESNTIGVLGLGGVLTGAVALIVVNGGLAGAVLAVLGFLLPLIITIALIALAVLFVLVIRTGALIFLTILSPIAIACFVLPGTEKYFQKWLDFFVRTLMVYPIIAAIFAVSNAMAAILLNNATGTAVMFNINVPVFAQAGQSDTLNTVHILAAVLVLYAPLVLIPFAFKIAGGAIGAVMNAASGRAGSLAGRAAKRVEQDKQNPDGFLGKRRIDARNRGIQARSDKYSKLQARASRSGWAGGKLYRGAARTIGGYNIEARASAVRAERSKQLFGQIETGRDEEIRGLTVNKAVADRTNAVKQNADKTWDDTALKSALVRETTEGTRQYKTLGGAWVDESHVMAGRNRWGKDTFAQQAALSYEMRKAADDDEVEGISTRYAALALDKEGGWGMSKEQAGGAFIGAGFENQGTHLEFKHTRMDENGQMQLNHAAFVKEAYEKKGSYPLAQMSAHTFKRLEEAYVGGDEDTKKKVAAVAETFMSRYGGAGGVEGMQGDVPQEGQRVPGGATSFQTNTPGAAHVAEAARKLAERTGVYRPLPPSPPSSYTPPDTPRQN